MPFSTDYQRQHLTVTYLYLKEHKHINILIVLKILFSGNIPCDCLSSAYWWFAVTIWLVCFEQIAWNGLTLVDKVLSLFSPPSPQESPFILSSQLLVLVFGI